VAKAAGQAALPEVIVTSFQRRVLPEYLEVTGRIEAVRSVDIRSRITGYLTKIFFRDGQFVKAGDPLYEIDPRPAVAKLEESQGKLASLIGEQKFAAVQVERYEKLTSKGAAPIQEYDSWKAKREENAGAVASARAAVESARLNVEFCTITSPIDGQIGRTQLQIGNLIDQDKTTLATVVSIDPVFVYFNVDEPTLLRVLRTLRAQTTTGTAGPQTVFVDIGLVDDQERHYPYRCVVDFLNNQVDPQTATITMRGRLDNPYDPDPSHPQPPLFRSGMFLRARLPLGQPAELMLVPEVAIGTNQDRRTLWLIGKDGLARNQDVIVGQKVGAWVAVRSADPTRRLDSEAQIVVRGLQRCRENKPVKAVAAAAESLQLDTLPVPSAPTPEPAAAGTAPASQAGVETLPRPPASAADAQPAGPHPP
jgi:RND family efflux transporter MFP subunit